MAGVQSLHRSEVAHERLSRTDRDDIADVLPDTIQQRREELPPFERGGLFVTEAREGTNLDPSFSSGIAT